MDNTEVKIEKAVFVGIIRDGEDERKVNEYLDELEFLAETAGATGDRKFVQRVDRPDNATYIRSGKLEEIAQYCEENGIHYVIFDDELTGMQQRNIEKVIKTCAVIDRTSLILEIFAQRAKTSYAKMQVELARYNYMLPRLAGMWTHLERQRGGHGTRGGMGETQIEVDRRIVKERITRLKEQLKKVDKQMATQRSNRGSLVRLSLVGYTNVGTVEFLYENGQFYFLEMNTRVQVEHPITEAVTGVDIVRDQIRISSGAVLGYEQADIHFNGYAMDCRINAEDPDTFIPQAGKIGQWHTPGGLDVRVDSEMYAGYSVPPHYDSLIAKLIVHGRTRNGVLMRLKRALEEFVIEGIPTTIPLHQKIISDPEFIDGQYNIHWLENFLKNKT